MNSSKLYSQLNKEAATIILPDVPLVQTLMFQQADWTGHTAKSDFQENNITAIISCSHTVCNQRLSLALG